MGSDMVVALKEASANGATLFGLNFHSAPNQRYCVQIVPGHIHEPGQLVPIANLSLPQARQTFTALGLQPQGEWGFRFGVNEHRVAVGVTQWQSRLKDSPSPLDGADLVRLALERGKSAMLAVEVLTDLIQRHGQKRDHIFLIADAEEAFVLESCGHYWALIECGHSRVVTGAAMIRQDWQRLSPGLATHVIERGWCQEDGNKLDFIRCLGENTDQAKAAQKRWGRASLTVSQQQGAIDLHFLRHMLSDHYAANRELLEVGKNTVLAGSFLLESAKADAPIAAWIAFGGPRTALYFPICLAGELPAGFGAGLPMTTSIEERMQELAKLSQGKEKDRVRLSQTLERLQTKFDLDVEEFGVKAHDCTIHGKPHLIAGLATEMMHQHVELFEKEYRRLFGVEERPAMAATVEDEVLFFA